MQPCPSGCSGEGYSTGRWNPSQVPLVTWELCTVYLWHHALPGNVWPVQWVLQKTVASTLPGRSSCCHRPLGKVCEWKTAFHVCLHVRARFLLSFPLFPCNTSRRAMCTLSFHLRSLMAFVMLPLGASGFTLQFENTYPHMLSPVCPVFWLTLTVTIHAIYCCPPVSSQQLAS